MTDNLIAKYKKLLENLEEKYNNYIEKRKKYEELKINFIDPTIRDSIEKQLIKAFKENFEFFNLHQQVEELRREIDKLRILIDGYKFLIKDSKD